MDILKKCGIKTDKKETSIQTKRTVIERMTKKYCDFFRWRTWNILKLGVFSRQICFKHIDWVHVAQHTSECYQSCRMSKRQIIWILWQEPSFAYAWGDNSFVNGNNTIARLLKCHFTNNRHLLLAKVFADVSFLSMALWCSQKPNLPHNYNRSIDSPARNARIQSRRSFSLATVKYNVYCGIDRPGNWSSTSQ